MLFRLSKKIVDALKHFGLNRFALRIGTDPVRTAMAIHRFSEVDWTKTKLEDGFCRMILGRAKYPTWKRSLCTLVSALVVQMLL